MKTKTKLAPVTPSTRPLATIELSNVVGGSGTTKSDTAGSNPLYSSFTGGSNPLHKA